jgi:hypothetical protein
VATSLSLGVEVGVGELPGGDVVEVGSEGGVLLSNEEDVNHVDEGETSEGPSETHDTLVVSFRTLEQGVDILGRHRGTRELESLGGSSESLASCKGR